MEWKNKVAVITGASTGIGKATKDLLRDKGCSVYNLDLAMTGDEIADHYIQCDIRNRQQIKEAIESFYEEKKIDMLFANAGIHLFANIEQTTDEQFDNLVSTNIAGTFFTAESRVTYHEKTAIWQYCSDGIGSNICRKSKQLHLWNDKGCHWAAYKKYRYRLCSL